MASITIPTGLMSPTKQSNSGGLVFFARGVVGFNVRDAHIRLSMLRSLASRRLATNEKSCVRGKIGGLVNFPFCCVAGRESDAHVPACTLRFVPRPAPCITKNFLRPQDAWGGLVFFARGVVVAVEKSCVRFGTGLDNKN